MWAVAVFCLALTLSVGAQIASDKITSLPGYNGPIGNQYSGYITVDPSHGRKLHYWFVESQGSPSTDPVILWLNGGPGCSSLDGLLYEHGPFKFAKTKDVKLEYNPYSWTKHANVIYLESPAGVGFSFSGDSSDYVTNDPKTTADNYQFLKLWFKNYPSFLNNDFYIAGESYAGVYVPWLAQQVQNGILSGSFTPKFKGIMVGNGVSNAKGAGDLTVYIPFLYGHGVISTKLHTQVLHFCPSNPSSPDCASVLNQAYSLTSGINMYGIYYDCYSQRPSLDGPENNVNEQVSCIDSQHANTWLNTPAVKQAIHVNNTLTWSICNGFINQNYGRTTESTVPIHKFLLSHGVRVLIYSGDTDFAVPYVDSEYWTTNAGLTEKTAWHQWSFSDPSGPQVAGMATEYHEGLTFVTVRGAGHMVPQFAPRQAFEMFTKFVNKQPF